MPCFARSMVWLVLIATLGLVASTGAETPDVGTLPTDANGRPLNLDFETGTLADWHAEGEAFRGQPIEGDTVAPRRPGMRSRHAGKFWIGTYERGGDAAQGTLTSVPFTVTKPFARFLIGAGPHASTVVELVRKDTNAVIARASGAEREDLTPVAVDLTPHLGKEIFIRLVDTHSGAWGHLNFDDFKLFDTKPAAPPPARPLTPDAFANEGLAPDAAARAMTVPEGFHVTLFAGEPDVVQPIAFTIDDRGRLWVAEAYSYPVRVPEAQARDRILIFEDTDGDGHFDTRKVFAEKLNLVSGLEVGFGGVYVGAAPQFLFIPDTDGDDHPDGPPRVLLDGWGMHDTHETLNSFKWGPDGWLYGCHGVFTHSRVGKPGTADADRTPLNAGIWRYHPTRHVFEVFAQGTSNPWGVDFNAQGEAFLTSCVIPHLYHIIPGARYERQAGSHFNPYTYDDIKTIADHRHYLGANPHTGNGRSDEAGGGHAHAGALIYQGGAWPEEYRGSIFMNNIHGARLNRDLLVPRGSGYVGTHAPDFLKANDRWSQIISLQSGPDGQVYMIDWYDKNQCHHNNVDGHDRTNGRIFRVAFGTARAPQVDLAARNGAELVAFQKAPNDWYARHARRLLQERGDDPDTRRLIEQTVLTDPSDVIRLRGYWSLFALGALEPRIVSKGLDDPSPHVRAWSIRLALAGGEAAPELVARLTALAGSDPSPVVRLALASGVPRLPQAAQPALLQALVAHGEDADDPNLPLMIWYAAEPLAGSDPSAALALASGSKIPLVRAFLVRRVAALGTPEALALVVDRLGQADRSDLQLALLKGLNVALQGRRQVAMPEGWPELSARLIESKEPEVRAQTDILALTFGEPRALRALRSVLTDKARPLAARQEALDALVKVHDSTLAPTLRALLTDPALRSPALRALASYDDPMTAEVILRQYPSLTLTERRDALNTLAARLDSSRALLGAVETGRVPAKDVSAEIVRQLRSHANGALDVQLGKVWGTVRDTPADKAQRIAETKALLTRNPPRKPDPSLGRAMFARTCQQCHGLFGIGGRVGPDLTGSNRADLDYLLANVLDPSALIGKDYQAHVIATSRGRILTGIIRSEDKDSVTLLSANDIVVIPKAEIQERQPSTQSMMPDDLWAKLSEHEIRSLVAYLAGPSQVPMLATTENVAAFFNGRDLSGWDGDPALWKVENEEIVGKTTGLKRNEFLRGELIAENFRLTLKIKLVRNEGNSGIQFRSEALPDGEMRGYQADAGPGWWGKLYEENGRGLLWSPSGESHLKPGEWNEYEIVAVGDRIRTFLNGAPCVVLDDPPGARRGIFAFQLHSGGATEVRFKEIRLELDPNAPKP